jgi:type I restriction enzyme S subunit
MLVVPVGRSQRVYIESFRLPLPPLDEQRAIGRILSSLDDRIELNRKMNLSLESLTMAIFQSWFVDFDPVRAKAEGREPEGMDAATAALFPSYFVDSTVGPIPTNWDVVGLGDLIELAYGKALKAEDRRPGGVPVMGSNGRIGWNDEALVKGPGIVVGRKGNPGTVTWVNSNFFPIDTAFYVKPKERASGLHVLRYQLALLGLPSLGADSAVPGLNRDMAYLTRLANPPKNLAERFESVSAPVMKRVELNDRSMEALGNVRDTLLPRLISGKLRTPAAEKLVEAVL